MRVPAWLGEALFQVADFWWCLHMQKREAREPCGAPFIIKPLIPFVRGPFSRLKHPLPSRPHLIPSPFGVRISI